MMEAKREQVFVGLFVLIAAALLIATVFTLSGAFAGSEKFFHAKFRNAAGLEPGASVHYAGGPKNGRVLKMQIDPADPALIDMTFSVNKDLPVKTDSIAAIMSYSPLGDNHLEIKPGSAAAPLAPSGALLQSKPYVGFNDISEQISNLAPHAQELIDNLNQRVKELRVTLDRVNDLLNDQNRANISASLADIHGMLAEDRPLVKSTLNHVNSASAKIEPLIDQLRKTTDQANETLKHIDSVIGENREDLRASIIKLRQSLTIVRDITQRIDQTLDVNSENIDEILDNLRHVTENLKEFTDTIKTNPSSLVHVKNPPEHKPGAQP
jgi:phospholipid/cholesterol/gamma-HCH transport system substrate-binding protein